MPSFYCCSCGKWCHNLYGNWDNCYRCGRIIDEEDYDYSDFEFEEDMDGRPLKYKDGCPTSDPDEIADIIFEESVQNVRYMFQ